MQNNWNIKLQNHITTKGLGRIYCDIHSQFLPQTPSTLLHVKEFTQTHTHVQLYSQSSRCNECVIVIHVGYNIIFIPPHLTLTLQSRQVIFCWKIPVCILRSIRYISCFTCERQRLLFKIIVNFAFFQVCPILQWCVSESMPSNLGQPWSYMKINCSILCTWRAVWGSKYWVFTT